MGTIPSVGRHSGSSPLPVARVRHPGTVVVVLAAAGISVSLMQTLVIPLIPLLPQLLKTSPSNASWAITATLLTAAVATPLFGRLGDMFGPKPILMLCAVLLTSGSLVAALSTTLIPTIVGRGLQGFGMPIIPLGISVLRAVVPAEKVGTAMGLMSASLGIVGALGLPLSAMIAEQFDWHALFWFAAALGSVVLVLFTVLVPKVASTSSDRLDPLGALGLAGGLVTLLLGISKGQSWGWTSALTLGMFASSMVIFAAFVWWQLRTPAPTVDLRTTIRRPVLFTNLASIGVGFGLFALSLVAPQILELPAETGFGLGQSMLHAGLWMAPGGLAMMVAAPIAARIAGVRGPRFTLVVGCLIIAGSYLGGLHLLSSPPRLLLLNVMVSVGVGFAFASLPSLINAAVPVSETAAANGINALARSLGTSISSAVMAAVLAGMTVSFAGRAIPSLGGFHAALLIAAAAAGIAAALALLIPKPGPVDAQPEPVPTDEPLEADALDHVAELESVLTALGRHTAIGPYADGERHDLDWLDRSAYLLLKHIDERGAMSVGELSDALHLEPAVIARHIAELTRAELLTGIEDHDRTGLRRMTLTATGAERLFRQRARNLHGLRQVVSQWDADEVAALNSYLGKLTDSIDGAPAPEPVTGRNAP